jgi:hypothetical protein
MLLKFASSFGFHGWLMIAGALILLSVPNEARAVSCQGGTTTVCGVTVPLPAMTFLGNIAIVPVPAFVFRDLYPKNLDFSFSV